MCGIFGAISTSLTMTERENVQQLGMMAALRGIDSTGICYLHTKKNKTKWEISKRLGNPVSFLTCPKINGQLNFDQPFVIMGHARAATQGSINEHNAHPIKEGPIIGCHNGTIWKWGPNKKEEDISSDSRVLFRKIAEGGLQTALEDAGDLAAYALSWINLNQMTFNLIRNSRRPLHVMWNAAGNTMYWASERGMLCWLAERSNYSFKAPEAIPEHTHIRLRLGNMTPLVSKLEIKPKVYTYSSPITNPYGQSSDWEYCNGCWMKKTICQCDNAETHKPTSSGPRLIDHVMQQTKKALGLVCEEHITVDGEIIEPNKVYIGPGHEAWTLKEFEARTKDGCSNCLRDLYVNDKIFWLRRDPVCEDCLDYVTSTHSPGHSSLIEGRFLN